MRGRHRHGRKPTLFHPHPRFSLGLVRDVALGAFILREIIKK